MRFQAKFRIRGGEIQRQIIEADSWGDAVNTLTNDPHVIEVQSVRNIVDIPLNEQISLTAKSPVVSSSKSTDPRFAQFRWNAT